MLKVLHLINYAGNGGSERYILSLAEKLHGKKCMFYLAYSMDGPLVQRAKELDIPAIQIAMRNPYDMAAGRELSKICREHDIDIVHTHFLRENYISVFSKIFSRGLKLVNTRHIFTEKSILEIYASRLFFRYVNRIIAVSNAVKAELVREGIDEEKIDMIYNGVDTDYWSVDDESSLREELDIARGDFVITCIGRFSDEKGHMFLIESFKRLKEASSKQEENTRIRLILAGEGQLVGECRDFAEKLGVMEDIVFMGYCKDVRKLLKASNLYVSPSRSETFGISIVEALASGIPVVATNAGGPVEIIGQSYKCGLIVEYGNTEEMAAVLNRFIRDTDFYNQCKLAATETVMSRFNLDTTADKTYNVYSKVCDFDKKEG